MGKSTTLDSLSKGNWVEDSHLTEVHDDKNLDIYKKVIENYSRKIDELKMETNEVDIPALDFPNYKKWFDILNSKNYYKKVQNWQGVVTQISNKSFNAKLYDLSIGGTNEIAEFDLEEVSPSDLSLLHIGANFYWSVGHYMENGQSVNRSDIRFQRLITLDEDDIELTKRNIEKKYSNLKERIIDNTNT